MMEPLIMAVLGRARWWSCDCNASSNLPNGFCGLMQELITYLIQNPNCVVYRSWDF